MGKSKAAKVQRRNNRISMFAIGFVVLILLGALLMQRRTLQNQLSVYAAEEVTLNERIEEEQQRTTEIEELREYMQTDEYAEEVAREKLGLVKDNEIVFEEDNTTVN